MNRLTPRDAESIRRIAAILRFFAPYFISGDWTPHIPTLQNGVFSSEFPDKNGTKLWTFINRNPKNVTGAQISVPLSADMSYFDAYHGVQLNPKRNGNQLVVSGVMISVQATRMYYLLILKRLDMGQCMLHNHLHLLSCPS